jgi:uncharacterized membrane protein
MTALALLLAVASLVALLFLFRHVRRLEERLAQARASSHALEARMRQLELLLPAQAGRVTEPRIPTAPPISSAAAAAAKPPDPALPTGESRAAPPPSAIAPAAPGLFPVPPPLPAVIANTPTAAASRDPVTWKSMDWERFMGARLFAWLGGLALFLGVAYFVKYSFDRNLIPPWARVMIGLLTGLVLLGCGLRLRKRAYAVTAQTLCATGIVVLYAALFVGHTLYRLPWLPSAVTFGLMVVITAAAFGLAVRLPALVIAILGILGGFLTPILVSTGGDQPGALFTYIALLDVGLLAVALYRRWDFLAALGALGTAAIQLTWAGEFFTTARTGLAWFIFSFFTALFVMAFGETKRRGRDSGWLGSAVAISAIVTLGFAGWLLSRPGMGSQPWAVFGFVLVADLALLAVAWGDERLAGFHIAAGAVAFGYLTAWQATAHASSLLGWALTLTLGFTLLHTAFPLLLRRRRTATRTPGRLEVFPIATVAAAMPFLLLTHAVIVFPLPDPSAVFAATMAILILLVGLTVRLRIGELLMAGLVGVALVEHAWLRDELFVATRPVVVLVWTVAFLACFMLPTVLWRRSLEDLRLPWIASALAGLPQFHVAYRVIEDSWPNRVMGLVPLAFAIPPAAVFAWLQRTMSAEDQDRNRRLAWFGGVVLFFVTVALPIQFDRQWLTIALALEGAALLWLLRRVPHRGLERVGIALLLIVFVRLAFNPAVLGYGLRGAWPIWNRWLSLYGISAVAMLIGARLLPAQRPPQERVSGRTLLTTLGVIVLFLLVNIEIADFFTAPGERARFLFSGHFARDMTYTIGWALSALGLVGVGISRRIAGARWAGLGLLGVTALKLFLHDLARLDQLYRVGALIAVAAIALTASMLYQRFVAMENAGAKATKP